MLAISTISSRHGDIPRHKFLLPLVWEDICACFCPVRKRSDVATRVANAEESSSIDSSIVDMKRENKKLRAENPKLKKSIIVRIQMINVY